MTLHSVFIIDICKPVIFKASLFLRGGFLFSKQANIKWKIYIFNIVIDPLTSPVALQSLCL